MKRKRKLSNYSGRSVQIFHLFIKVRLAKLERDFENVILLEMIIDKGLKTMKTLNYIFYWLLKKFSSLQQGKLVVTIVFIINLGWKC